MRKFIWKAVPKAYGWFHLLSLAIISITTYIFALYGRRIDKKKIPNVVFGFGIFLLVIEVYKQIFCTIDAGFYRWDLFPFQFCSVPIYVCLAVPFVSNKAKQICYNFLEMYGLIAATVVLLYPVTVLSATINISIHSMMWHGAMFVVAIFLHETRDKKISKNEFLQATAMWFSFVAMAIVMNIVGYNFFFKNTNTEFNMFMLSPYYTSSEPISRWLSETFGWSGFVLAYLLAFSFAALLVMRLSEVSYNNKNRKEVQKQIQNAALTEEAFSE